jgi:AraC-like DNA-binding protein
VPDPVVEQASRRPDPALAAFVGRYVGYRLEGFAPGMHAGLPSRHLTLVVSLDSPVDIAAMPDPGQRPERFEALVGGLHAAPVRIRHDGRQHGVQLELTPLGARSLLGLPAGELAHTVAPLDAVVGRIGRQVADELAAAPDWPARFAALDRILLRLLGRASSKGQPGEPQAEVVFAWRLLAASHGGLTVDALAQEVGWSRRHLSQRFRSEYGIAPKVMSRVMRFETAKQLLVAGGVSAMSAAPLPVAGRVERGRVGTGRVATGGRGTAGATRTLADVAAACGYADQAHMTREWNALAGASPSSWLAAEQLPFVQDGTADQGAR